MIRSRAMLMVIVGGWLVTMLAVSLGLQAARRWALAELSTAAAQADWQQYKQTVTAEGRRTPKSDEPPTLILLRDWYGGVLISALGLTTSLYAFLSLVLAGMWRDSAGRGPGGRAAAGDGGPVEGEFRRKER